ncbi:prolyl aminopeptidase [Allorhizocola rhizosphaerae]|uniref:prolyl aminopeptidase n=1 Tax=Allorhizocola rhizosphaerae TaxID=1872709 RepID=UPI000E3D6883|nr:prolyl aminopeptidase [Allorhizocola rhizosphaerae]
MIDGRGGGGKPLTYPGIEPYEHGMLDVGDGHRVYWEVCGNPRGKPAVVLHGGPGSGASPYWRRFFDPDAYRVVLFDQRGCGRSTPHASEPGIDLSTNTTHHLIRDIELLRTHHGIDRWLVFGGSWGSTLGLAYAQAHPARVGEIVLFSVVGTSRREVRWVTRDVGRLFPEQWQRFRDGVPLSERDGDLAAAYSRLLHDPDPTVREKAAIDWCTWEDAHVDIHGEGKTDLRYADPVFRMAFARLVTHYWSHAAWLDEGQLLRDAHRLAGIPGLLVHGRLDISSPPEFAWHLAQAWPDAQLHLIGGVGHGVGGPAGTELLIAATDRFARQPGGHDR